MNDLPALVVERIQAMFAVTEADQVYASLRASQAELAAQRMSTNHIERALIACLLAADQRLSTIPSAERSASRRLASVRAIATQLTTDVRGVCFDAGIDLHNLAEYPDLAPADLPIEISFPEPLFGLVRACETLCVTACCGLDAYDIAADNMTRWANTHGLPSLLKAADQFEHQQATLRQIPGPIRGHDMLFNHEWFGETDCIDYLNDRWRPELVRTIETVGGPQFIQPEWRTTTVRTIAAGVCLDRDFSRLPVLADALEDAGCDSEPVLTHLRAGDRHDRFCWVIDLIAGR